MHFGYLLGYGPSALSMVAARTAATRAAFLPPLRGCRVLDVGCGPGSITAGLAAQHHRQDMSGPDLACYVAERLAGPELDAARSWAGEPVPATVFQRWVEILAVRAG